MTRMTKVMRISALTETSTGLMLDKEGRVKVLFAGTRKLLILRVKLMKFPKRKS